MLQVLYAPSTFDSSQNSTSETSDRLAWPIDALEGLTGQGAALVLAPVAKAAFGVHNKDLLGRQVKLLGGLVKHAQQGAMIPYKALLVMEEVT